MHLMTWLACNKGMSLGILHVILHDSPQRHTPERSRSPSSSRQAGYATAFVGTQLGPAGIVNIVRQEVLGQQHCTVLQMTQHSKSESEQCYEAQILCMKAMFRQLHTLQAASLQPVHLKTSAG